MIQTEFKRRHQNSLGVSTIGDAPSPADGPAMQDIVERLLQSGYGVNTP